MKVEQLVKLLEEAIESNDLEKVKTLLQVYARLSNAGGKMNTTLPLLWQAAVRGRHEIVELLIKSGAKVQELKMDYYNYKFAGSQQITILHWMGIKALPCTDDHIKVGEILVSHGADANAYNPVKKVTIEPLRYAVGSGNIKWTEFLLRNGVDEGRVLSAAASMIFSVCPVNSRMDLLFLLLKYGLDTGFRDVDGNNLLIMLSKQENTDNENSVKIAEFLLDAGVPIDEVDKYGLTPLHYSIFYLNIRLASFLLKRGANVNKIHGNQDTPLFIAVFKCNKILVNLLLSYGADINAKNGCQQTALHFAVMYKNDAEMITLLIEKGAVFALNKWGQTPFFMLLKKNLSGAYDECVKRMIREFAKLNFEKIPIASVDLEQVQTNVKFQAYFEKCLTELNEIFGSKFYGNYSFYSILKMSKNMKKLTNLSKNEEFVAMFDANLDKLPCYGKDLRRILDSAIVARDRLDAVESRLKCIFGNHLPAVVIRILACELTPEDLPPR